MGGHKTGDAAFDERFGVVTNEPARLPRVLNPAARRAYAALHDQWPENSVIWSIEEGRMCVKRTGIYTDVQQFERLVQESMRLRDAALGAAK